MVRCAAVCWLDGGCCAAIRFAAADTIQFHKGFGRSKRIAGLMENISRQDTISVVPNDAVSFSPVSSFSRKILLLD